MRTATQSAPLRLPFALILTLLLASCNIDGSGFFSSTSSPDDRFDYSRKSPDPVWAGPNPAAKFSFVFITDSHIMDGSTARLDKLVPVVSNDLFLVHGGDITQDGQAKDWLALKAWIANLGIPVYAAIGNHDLYFSGWNNMPAALSQTSFTLAIGAEFRLIVLDSGNATLGRGQMAWLENCLARATESSIVIATHHPLFDTGFSEFNWSDPEESAALMKLFARYKVKLVLTGHTHRLASRHLGDTTYVVGQACRAMDSGQVAIRVTVDGAKVNWATFPLP